MRTAICVRNIVSNGCLYDNRTAVTVNLTEHDYSLIRYYAASAEIGGVSRIRISGRAECLTQDQVTGQACTYAYHRWRYGTTRWYQQMRRSQDRHPTQGDGGWDVPDWDIPTDVKGSRGHNIAAGCHHLWVRPGEYHPDWYYVLALHWQPRVVLVGWAMSSDWNWTAVQPVILRSDVDCIRCQNCRLHHKELIIMKFSKSNKHPKITPIITDDSENDSSTIAALLLDPLFTTSVDDTSLNMPPIGESLDDIPQVVGILVSEVLMLYHSRLMDDLKAIKSELPERMRESHNSEYYPVLDDIYGTLGLMRKAVERLRGQR